ncbi:MAG: hypothetical protein JJE29_03795 [Peptostreptococcaceae bacterium]|nr:hypothetical protein [Peptostreptococcaceae bacterium]
MDRLTEWIEEKKTYISKHIEGKQNGGYSGEAIDRLAKFENLLEDMLGQKEKLPGELAKLREEGKEKSYRFREIFAKKLTIEALLTIMKDFGIE